MTSAAPPAHAVFGTWREHAHDDLLLSLAVAVWYGEHGSAPLQVFIWGLAMPLDTATASVAESEEGVPVR